MLKRTLVSLLFLSSASTFADPVQDLINSHLKKYAQQEHFSAIQVSVKVGDKVTHYTAGTRSLDPDSPPLTSDDLFDIGSITKSFTSTLVIKADSEGRLSLKKTVGDYLKQYPHWAGLTLAGLLDMSTGIPNYSNAPTINYLFSKNLTQFWKPQQLVNLVYSQQHNPPLMDGYFYSNTGYILLDMILCDIYKEPFKKLLTDKIITPLGLKNTFYPVPDYPESVLARMAHGYSWNVYDNPELLGQDVTKNNLSWAGAAGAIVANSGDVLSWVDELFVKDRLLTAEEKKTMQSMISLTTGKPIRQTDKSDPKAFALGISQGYDEVMGTYWFYEGKTLGYRAVYMYSPASNIIIVTLYNSATNSENDKVGELIQKIYQQVKKG
ncbi:serine hydrolase domain-containing protein [Legionella sp. CNM-4043-24]|uniref:serine hydrolase domain-containing protein n=1 Tax=Legionella sp. CNM-4043-24 TaxID=3421646 RepID=UPI00403AA1E2